jgi:phage gp36-like protein
MYCTVFDVRNALTPGAVADATTAASLDDAQITDAINEADSRINTYLPSDYTVPQTSVQQGDPVATFVVAPDIIRFWSRDIAAYLATLTYKKHMNVPEDDPVRLRYEMAMEALRLAKDGKITLPPDANAEDDLGNVFVYNQYTGNLFGAEDFLLGPTIPGMTRYRARTLDL